GRRSSRELSEAGLGLASGGARSDREAKQAGLTEAGLRHQAVDLVLDAVPEDLRLRGVAVPTLDLLAAEVHLIVGADLRAGREPGRAVGGVRRADAEQLAGEGEAQALEAAGAPVQAAAHGAGRDAQLHVHAVDRHA